jgi:Protein of unknown function (DUF2867)
MAMRPGTTVNRVHPRPDTNRDFGDFDYADAFELHTAGPDSRTALEWLRAGLEESPVAVRWLIVIVHTHALRFRLGPRSGGDHVLGWKITKLDPGEARLEASGPLIHARLVGRRSDPHTVRLDTFVTFNNRRAGPVVWALVGPLHRKIAPQLLKRAARGSDRREGFAADP